MYGTRHSLTGHSNKYQINHTIRFNTKHTHTVSPPINIYNNTYTFLHPSHPRYLQRRAAQPGTPRPCKHSGSGPATPQPTETGASGTPGTTRPSSGAVSADTLTFGADYMVSALPRKHLAECSVLNVNCC